MEIDINHLVIKDGKCGTEEALKVLCGKWNMLIIQRCLNHPSTTNNLYEELVDIPKTSLSKKLNYLTENELLVYTDHGYIATQKAIDLFNIAKSLGQYLNKNVPEAITQVQRNQYVNKMIGQKWKARVMWVLSSYKIVHFNELCRCLDGISHKVLKEVLLDMENTGMITRTSYNEKVPRVDYSLTQKGKEIFDFSNQLSSWSKKYGFISPNITINL